MEAGAVTTMLAVAVGGLWLLASPHAVADEHLAALRTADSIREAALSWQSAGAAGCPTPTQLQHERLLGSTVPVDDPWGGRFRLVCTREQMLVRSPGPDGKLDTDDDVRVLVD